MIAKNNKHSPATLYLLNAKNSTTRQQEERKSARLTFNKKKSARSISQYQKWNPTQPNNKQSTNTINNQSQIYQHSSRTNSEIKKIILTKNQFSLQPIPVEKKLYSIIEIFKGTNGELPARKVNTVGTENVDRQRLKSLQAKSGQMSLLSLKQINDQYQKQPPSRNKPAHKRTQSMVNHTDPQQNTHQNIETILTKIQRKFKLYEKHSSDWKQKQPTQEIDYLLDDMLAGFKSIFNEIVGEFTTHIVGNLQYFEQSISQIAKDYELQIAQLKDQLQKNHRVDNIIEQLMKTVNQKHYKGVVCSKVFEDLQRRGMNLEYLVKENQQMYHQIIKMEINKTPLNIPHLQNCQLKTFDHNQNSDDDFYSDEEKDYVEQDSNWNDHFQNRESIKGVLKYINNHNQNKINDKQPIKSNLNSTGYLITTKDKKDMKIDNWKSFEDKSITQYKKIMSQR